MLKPAAVTVSALVIAALAGCTAPAPDNADDGVLRVVASTSVYGEIVHVVGGVGVEVTSIITDPSQDPHEFEANGRVQLALSRADVVVVNGGGYDDFATTMLEAAGNDGAEVITAVDLSSYDSTAAGFNEHVWYDYPTVAAVARAIEQALADADPDDEALYAANAEAFLATVTSLEERAGVLATARPGAGVVITEPVPGYLLERIGLTNLTPPEFSEAIEAGTDVPAALLQRVLDLIGDGSVAVVVYNTQTGGPQTDAVIDAATDAQVPVIGVTETLPGGYDYASWQSGILDQLDLALRR